MARSSAIVCNFSSRSRETSSAGTYVTMRGPVSGPSHRSVWSTVRRPTYRLRNSLRLPRWATTSCRSQAARNSGDCSRSRASSAFAQVTGHGGAEAGGHQPLHLLQVHDRRAPLLVGVGEDHAVAVLGRHRVQVAQQQPVGAVVGEDVVPAVLQARRVGLQLLQHRPQRRGERRAVGAGRGVDGPGQLEEVGPLGGVEQQRAGEGVEDLHGDMDVAGLLQPGVPGDADRGELGDLLAPQARGAAPRPAGQSHPLGRDALAAAAQEGGELVPPHRRGRPPRPARRRLVNHGRHDPSLPAPAACCQVLLLPGSGHSGTPLSGAAASCP
jgi:hypothetical protein